MSSGETFADNAQELLSQVSSHSHIEGWVVPCDHSRSYIGMTENEFKTRYNNHKLSFNDKKHLHDTVLSKHIWDLKDKNIDYAINWRIVKRAKAYKGNPSCCNLCLSEKLCILSAKNALLLNKKSELVTKCRHEKQVFHDNQSPEASLQPFLNLNTYI